MKGKIEAKYRKKLQIKEPMYICVNTYAYWGDPKNPDWPEEVNVTLFPDGSYEFEDGEFFSDLRIFFEGALIDLMSWDEPFDEEDLEFEFGAYINEGLEVPEYDCYYDKNLIEIRQSLIQQTYLNEREKNKVVSTVVHS